jgi:hypothetical protein
MLLVVSLQALTGKVEANWAAPASVGVALAVVGLWCAASNQIFRSRFFGRSMKSLGLPVSLLLNVGFTVAFLSLPVGLERLGWAGVTGKDPRVPFVALESLAADVDAYLKSLPSEERPQFIASKDRHTLAYLDARLGRKYAVVYWDPKLEVTALAAGGRDNVGSVGASEPKNLGSAEHHWALQKPLQLAERAKRPEFAQKDFALLYVDRQGRTAEDLATLPQYGQAGGELHLQATFLKAQLALIRKVKKL